MEQKVQDLLVELYVHVAAMPWKDEQFMRSEVLLKAAQDHTVVHIKNEILTLVGEKNV